MTTYTVKSMLCVLFCLTLVGCGDSDTTQKQELEPTPTTQSISGYIVDGYIAGASVCIDLNTNDTCDEDEPTTIADEDGLYTLETTLTGEGFTLLAYGGVDTATGKPQTQAYRALISLEANTPVTNNITPLTSIAYALFLQNKAQDLNTSYEDAKAQLATALEIDPEEIEADPMQSNTLFAATQRIVQTSSLLQIFAEDDSVEGCSICRSVALTPTHSLAQELQIQIDQDLQKAIENIQQEILELLSETSTAQTRADLQRELSSNIEQLKAKIKSGEAYVLSSLLLATPVTYEWSTSSWSSCKGECGEGNGEQTRIATCQASTGESVADGMCSEPKPATTQACTASLCPIITYSWSTTAWSTCSGACGTNNATQSRNSICISSEGESVADGMCSTAKPIATRSCTASLCPPPPPPPITYSWIIGEWGVCSGDCGTNNATQTRSATCQASTGGGVADGMCSTTKPATTQECTASLCNVAPTINTIFSDIDLVENSGTTNYELNISDADGDALTLSVESNNTSIITVTPNYTNPINQATYATALDFNLTTVADAFGLVTITITVADGEDNATTSFDVNVTEVVTIAIKKTGQTRSYNDSGTEVTDGSLKDDGFYEVGVEHNYTRDDTNNIVTDNVTGLMWHAASVTKPWLTSENYTTCSNNTTSQACYDTSGDTATSYCQDLSLGGYTDWRLPTAEELEGTLDYGKVYPAIDITFQNISSDYYWSSTTNESYKYTAWLVSFRDGSVNRSVKLYNGYVRCVRAGQ
ncbi:MAG: DUF1566 domain-containing protein [Candidatus Cloacimonetes bacterium]|jgi:hypothetical protein|nr:DUF1566 domain-containing protein [Candidatus Cloacimonadota bacterium]